VNTNHPPQNKEKTMRKCLAPTLAVLTVAVLVPTLAGAAGNKKCSLDLTVMNAPVETTGNPPMGGTETRGGIVDGKLCDKQFTGATRVVITYTAPGQSTITSETFGPLGSFKAQGQGRGVPQPDGSTSLSGSGQITGGTGIYKGATGSFSSTGTRPANSHVNIVHLTGTLRS
jgi:hypothetical protein